MPIHCAEEQWRRNYVNGKFNNYSTTCDYIRSTSLLNKVHALSNGSKTFLTAAAIADFHDIWLMLNTWVEIICLHYHLFNDRC
jgi:hypothetical protein